MARVTAREFRNGLLGYNAAGGADGVVDRNRAVQAPAETLMRVFSKLSEAIVDEGAAALVSLIKVEGSSPRELDARMVVRPSGGFHGTIGGGALEWEALKHASTALKAGRGPARERRLSLGPDLGQCCGGRVAWRVETFDGRDLERLAVLAAAEANGEVEVRASRDATGRIERTLAEGELAEQAGQDAWRERHGRPTRPLLLFGAGHVGRALVLALAPLAYSLRWIDPRPKAFPAYAPPNAKLVLSLSPVDELNAAPLEAAIVVMTHSHPLDLEIVTAALKPPRFSYVGLIGSATKRARFESQMRAAGLSMGEIAALICPIGLPDIHGKEPATIAASVVAQLLILAPPP